MRKTITKTQTHIRTINHYYVFYLNKKGKYNYERTCGTQQSAEHRVKELKTRGITAIWLQNHLIKGALI